MIHSPRGMGNLQVYRAGNAHKKMEKGELGKGTACDIAIWIRQCPYTSSVQPFTHLRRPPAHWRVLSKGQKPKSCTRVCLMDLGGKRDEPVHFKASIGGLPCLHRSRLIAERSVRGDALLFILTELQPLGENKTHLGHKRSDCQGLSTNKIGYGEKEKRFVGHSCVAEEKKSAPRINPGKNMKTVG